jgi:hypothetical protein
MNCGEVEILLADYVDGTLHGTQDGDPKSAVEMHLAQCAACSELARDAAAAVEFMGRAADVEAPPELVTRLLFEITAGPSRAVIRPSLGRRLFGGIFGSWLGKWLEPVLEPRYAMSMAMTVLSFAMIFRFAGISPRQLTAADLDPVKIWSMTENRAARVWERGVKYYESLRVVFEIQSQLREWSDDSSLGQPATGQPNADNAAPPPASEGVSSK